MHSRGIQGLSKIIGIDQTGSKKKMLCRIVKNIFPSSGLVGLDVNVDDQRPHPQADNLSVDSTPWKQTSDMEVCGVLTKTDSSKDHKFSDISGYAMVSQVSFYDFDAMVQRCEYFVIKYVNDCAAILDLIPFSFTQSLHLDALHPIFDI